MTNNNNKVMMSKKVEKIAALAIFFLVFVASSVAHAQDTLRLTLDDALKIATSENLTVKIADKEITRQDYAKKESYASLFPQIDYTANYQRAIKKQVVAFSGQSFKMGLNNTYTTGFALSMPLVSVPLWQSLGISAKNVELAIEKARSSKIELVDQVRQAFFGSILAADSYHVYKENYDNTIKNYNEVKQKYESGTAAKYDLIRAEVNVKNAEPSLYDAQNSVVLAKWKLKALIGIDLSMPIVCDGTLMDYKSELERVSLYDSTSLEKNTELKQLDIQEMILKKSYKMQLAKYYPSLNLALNYQWMAMDDTYKFSSYKWNPYSTGALSLIIPIFSGGQRYYSLKQTRTQQQQLNLQRENLRRNLEVSVKQTLSTMETAIKQYDAANAGINGAETGYEISRKRYEVGSGTLLEMNDAQLALLQARLNLNQSVYNYLITKSSLDKILGVIYTGEVGMNRNK
jgi:outer membrane protein